MKLDAQLKSLEAGADLTREQAEAVMEELLEGRLANEQVVRLLSGLREKGESVEELVGFATAMRRHAQHAFAPPRRAPEGLVDTCGTGGSGRGTFNISTAAAFVAAGAGARVAKHGNRSYSSRSGSADVLEALGVKVDLPPETAGRAIEEVGIGFLFAQTAHTAARHASAARKQLGGRTVFNLLGPLTNPAGAPTQVIGVIAPMWVEMLAHALAELGSQHAFVVHGEDGLDEISLSGETLVAEVTRAGGGGCAAGKTNVRIYRVAPEDFGLSRAPLETLAGGDAATNATIIRAVLRGERGPRRDIVVANAAAALVAAGRAAGFKEGARLAAESVDSLAAFDKLLALSEFTNR
jgi:anthranilate phosphoribosyltransferase